VKTYIEQWYHLIETDQKAYVAKDFPNATRERVIIFSLATPFVFAQSHSWQIPMDAGAE